MKKSTLCFCIKGGSVLLAMKKRGFGVGKWNGYGGKIQEGEDPKTAAAREIQEESSLVINPEDLKQAGVINFYFDGNPVFECYVYLSHKWEGDPRETEEMRPQWFPIAELPLNEMWAADGKWVPLVLSGKRIGAEVNFNEDGSEVRGFAYKEINL